MMDTEEICVEILENQRAGHGLWPLLDKVNCIYAPPAEPSDTSIVQRKLRRPIKTNTGGELLDRIRMTDNLLKPKGVNKVPGILFNKERCSMIAWEMRTGWRWPEHKSETKNASEVPLDKDNHGPEALGRYVKGHLSKTDKVRTSRQSRVRSGRR